ncbi:MAG: hypothetical protein K2G93_00890 [Rikenella sp.]|nr:hypothetical protein [Rikenella sp.]
MYAVGTYGYNATSSVTAGPSTYSLNFQYGGIYPDNSGGRARGLPLRCLQE